MVLLQYLLKLSISLGIVWLFYHFVLRKLTFYNSNRWYLIGYTLLCFFIPFIDISPVLQKNQWTGNRAVSWIPLIEEYSRNEIISQPSYSFFTIWNIACMVFVAGMLVMMLRLVFQLMSFVRMMKAAKPIPGDTVNLFQIDENIIPFSFGNSIFINQHLHSPEELQEIIRHEFVHVKQKHSVDIIWGELLCMANWYNPFAWLLRRSIRQNLEFIADNKVLENGIDRKQYQYLLLKVIGNNQFSIAPKFNFSSLKKRIAMMNKLKTARLHLVRFLFILPLLAVILLSFRKQISESLKQDKKKVNETAIAGDFTDTVPEVTELNEKGYFIDVKGKDGHCILVVKDKNRKEVDRVLLTKWNENQQYYEKRYGEIPEVPAEPPVPPTPPTDEYDSWKKVFLKRNPDVKDISWLFTTVREKFVIEAQIFKKDGIVEKYDLKEDADKAKAEQKYGELPLPVLTPSSPPTKKSIYELSATQEINRANIGDDLEIDENKATVHLKNGAVEEYNLANDAEKKKFETKYGKIIEVSARVEGVNEPVKVIDYPASERVSEEPITVTGYLIKKKASEEPITVTGYLIKKKTSEEPITVVGHPIKKIASEEPVSVIAVEGTRTAIAPTRIAGETAVTFLNEEGNLISGEEEILVTITKRTTREELDQFVRQMKEKGFELKFDNIKYDNGILVRISGTIKYKNGQGSFSETGFNKLIISGIKDGDRFHLKIDTRVNKTVS